MTELNDVSESNETDEPTRDRRDLITKAGVAAAVAAVAGLSVSRTASAANGDTVYVGNTVSGTSTTLLNGGTTFRVTNGDSDSDASIYGTQSGTDGTGVRGDATGEDGFGVYGRATGTDGIGVYGSHDSSTTPGVGVKGESQVGPGVAGIGSTYDLLASGNGRIGFGQNGQSGSSTDTGSVGSIARDSAGNLWYCYATNKWQRMAGPNAAGAFHAIDPIRAFDSRIASYTGSGVLAPNASKVVSVKDGHDSAGTVTDVDAVPVGASAVAFNVTVTGTTGPNFLAVSPGGAAGFTTSSLNWTGPGQSVANGSIVKLDSSRQVKIFGGDQSGSTQVILDITGYFL